MALVFQARGTYEPGHSSPVDHGPRLDLGSRCPMGRRATRLTPRGEPALCQARRHRGRWGRRRTDRTDTAPPEVARGGVNPSYALLLFECSRTPAVSRAQWLERRRSGSYWASAPLPCSSGDWFSPVAFAAPSPDARSPEGCVPISYGLRIM